MSRASSDSSSRSMPPVSSSSKATPVPLAAHPLAVAGDPRLGVGDRLAAAGEPVDQGALADVGEADDGDGGQAHRPHGDVRPRSRVPSGEPDRGRATIRRRPGRARPVVSISTASSAARRALCSRVSSRRSRSRWAASTASRSSPVCAARRRARSSARGGEEDLQRRVGADHGADVAALGDVAAGGDQLALAGDHRLAHARVDGDARGGLGHLGLADRGADVLAVELDPLAVERDLERARRARAIAVGVVEVGAALERRQRHAAVHRPGVEVGEAELRGDGAGDGGLAGPGGPVDGDDHGRQRRDWRALAALRARGAQRRASEARSASKPG